METTSKDLNPTITLDLGNTYCFNKMSMLTSASVAVPIKTGVIETADDFDFTQNVKTVCTVKDIMSGVEAEFGFKMQRARFVRFRTVELELSEWGGNPAFCIYELELCRTKAAGVEAMNDYGEVYVPSVGSHCFTAFAANPVDSEGCALSAKDFPISYELLSDACESAVLDTKTGAINVYAGQADADMEIKAALVSNPEVSVSYTACLTNEYAGNVSLHKGYYVTMPTLVNSDGENTEILSEASALVFDAVGIQEGKTDTLLFIVTSYTDSSKKTLSAVNVYSVPIAEFENNTYSLPFTGLEDNQGKISVFVWNGISASSPVLEVIEY